MSQPPRVITRRIAWHDLANIADKPNEKCAVARPPALCAAGVTWLGTTGGPNSSLCWVYALGRDVVGDVAIMEREAALKKFPYALGRDVVWDPTALMLGLTRVFVGRLHTPSVRTVQQ